MIHFDTHKKSLSFLYFTSAPKRQLSLISWLVTKIRFDAQLVTSEAIKILLWKRKDYFRFKNWLLISWLLLKWPKNFPNILQNLLYKIQVAAGRIVYSLYFLNRLWTLGGTKSESHDCPTFKNLTDFQIQSNFRFVSG